MTPTPLIMICTCDLAGQVRGKAMPRARLDANPGKGIGWTPTNSQITAHGPIAPSPYGALGDTFLKPDYSTLIDLQIDERTHERFVLADIMTLAGEAWECCPRGFLKKQIDALAKAGLQLKAAFEHEFAYLSETEQPNSTYTLRGFRQQGPFADHLFEVLHKARMTPETFMPEYGPSQYELTIAPSPALRAADEAVILRELVRATASAHDHRASFTPLLRPDAVGNGVHVHFSLSGSNGQNVNYDPNGPLNVAPQAAAFLEGIRRHLPAMIALTASGTISYLRLQPNRWSAFTNNIAAQDREAALRICPVFGDDPQAGFHFEYRAADATASPYLVMGAIIAAGLAGLSEGQPFKAQESQTERLPQNLETALDSLESSEVLCTAMGKPLHDLFIAHKRFECTSMQGTSALEQCQRYAKAY